MHVVTDVGTKYTQPVGANTPDNVTSSGFRMEDAYATVQTPQVCHIAVADGHGSVAHSVTQVLGGFESATAAVRSLAADDFALVERDPVDAFARVQTDVRTMSLAHLRTSTSSIVAQATGHLAIIRRHKMPAVSMHGTTLTHLAVRPGQYACASVGDSAAMHVRADGSFARLTVDDDGSDPEEDARMRALGAKPRRGRYYEHAVSPRSEENYLFQLTRSIGHFGNVAISQMPHVTVASVAGPARYVVATDGLWGYVDDATVARLVAEAPDARTASVQLLDLATRCCTARKRDNCCIAVVFAPERRVAPTLRRRLRRALAWPWRRSGP